MFYSDSSYDGFCPEELPADHTIRHLFDNDSILFKSHSQAPDLQAKRAGKNQGQQKPSVWVRQVSQEVSQSKIDNTCHKTTRPPPRLIRRSSSDYLEQVALTDQKP